MAPGPNNLLSMANAKRYGIKAACYAGIGRLVAFMGMITLAATGLATVLYTSEKLFLVIKIVGGLYLLLTYRSAHVEANQTLSRFSRRASLWRLTDLGWQMIYHQGTPTDAFDREAT